MPPLLRAAHLEPTLAVTAIATALSVAVGRGWGALWVALAVLPGQLAVGWHNDLVDARVDAEAGRRDKPVAAGQVRTATLTRLAPVALTAAALASLASGLVATAAHAVAITAALAHNAGVKRTPWSPLPWFGAFGLLPVFVWLGVGQAPPWWAVAAGALLGGSAHFTNTLPDLELDAAAGADSLPGRLGPRRSLVAAGVLLVLGGAVVAAGARPLPGFALAAVAAALGGAAGVVVVGLAGRRRLAFRLTMLAAIALVLAFLLAGGSA